jgi:hypothetical protein
LSPLPDEPVILISNAHAATLHRRVATDTGRTSACAAAGVKRETVMLLAALVGAAALCGALAIVRHWLL